jgi:uncharacterized hydrophobic protein (TIGR00271 family)
MKDSSKKPLLRQKVFNYFPTLEREERLELVDRISVAAEGGTDFTVMMVLSATLASLGLLQGSTAVVIGAMLVAPLMGPLVAAGLALAQGNAHFFRKALVVFSSGIGMSFVASIIFGLLNPGFEPSMEIEARGSPDMLDLIIAFASGMVAAYAMGRPNVSGTLAGVAIAAALLPPLVVVGIGLTNAHPVISGHAAILFATNTVAIILGGALVFRLLGMHSAGGEFATPKWVIRTTLVLALLAVMLAAPLFLNMLEKKRGGQARPSIFPVSAEVRDAVVKFIDTEPGIHLITMGRLNIEPKAAISLVLSVIGGISANFKSELIQVVKVARGDENVVVRVFVLLEAPDVGPSE